MKQGTTRRLQPKDKHSKASWTKRNEARKERQEQHAADTNPRKRGDDDGVEYADPRDPRDERVWDPYMERE